MINAIFDGTYSSITSQPAYLHDYGQVLRVFGLDLPSVVEAHFALEESGESVLVAGTCEDGIARIPIPDTYLAEAGSFFCYIFDRSTSAGRTCYKIKIPVVKRADLPTSTVDPTEEDTNAFAQVIAAVTAQAEAAAASADEAEAAKDELLTGISIGTVETLTAGSEATASLSETEDGVALNLGIPQGEQGEQGETGEIEELKVTLTCDSNSQLSCDRTYSEIISALKAGKHVYMFAPAPGYYFGAVSSDTHLEVIEAWQNEYVSFGFFGIETDPLSAYTGSNEWKMRVAGFRITKDDEIMVYSQYATTLTTAYTYPVTITVEDGNATCNKTFSRIKAAVSAGKHVFALLKYENEDVKILPLAYIDYSTAICFGIENLYAEGEDYKLLSEYAYVYSDDSAIYAGQNVVSLVLKSDFTELEARVTALENAINNG